jgi:U3 small nucleolar RNA-associated protein 4
MKTIKAHLADILCMAMKNDGTQFYSTGVDRKVVQLTMADLNNPSSWVVSGEKRYHSHDVRSILWIQDRPHECLVTGGMDTLLIMSSPVNEFPYLKQYRMPSFPHSPPIQLAHSAKLLMARLENCIQIWRLGDGKIVKSNF